METKDMILEAAIRLFNERGYALVSMRDIADSLGRSVGNLTYHYKKKSDLILAIVLRQLEELEGKGLDDDIDLEGFDRQLSRMLAFQRRYSFYFTSMFELRSEYPELADYQRRASDILVEYFHAVFRGFEDKGLFRASRSEAQRRDAALGVVLLRMSWMQRSAAEASEQDDQGLQRILWAVLYPKLTPKGLRKFAELRYGGLWSERP